MEVALVGWTVGMVPLVYLLGGLRGVPLVDNCCRALCSLAVSRWLWRVPEHLVVRCGVCAVAISSSNREAVRGWQDGVM